MDLDDYILNDIGLTADLLLFLDFFVFNRPIRGLFISLDSHYFVLLVLFASANPLSASVQFVKVVWLQTLTTNLRFGEYQ